MDPKPYWIGFNLVKGVGAVRLKALLEYFGSLEIAWQASPETLRAAGLPQKVVQNLVRVRQDVRLDQLYARIQNQGIQVMTWEDELYPRRLKEIDQPPPVLYLKGDLKLEDEWAVAIVGTRRVTVYGRQIADEVATFLARNGITVVSGLARGVDTIAHQAALQAGGRTLAVLGCGVDQVYPPENRRLAEQMIKQGALISDFAPGTPPDSVNFPPRNRIISGLTLATVVIEAGETSGALITATFAVEQGRDVFAVPGNIHGPQSKGTNKLIQQGARPLLKPDDVLEALELQQVQEHRYAQAVLPVDEVEVSILKQLGSEPVHLNELGERTGLPIEKVSSTLTMLELKGYVRQVGGMNYVSVREAPPEYRTGDYA